MTEQTRKFDQDGADTEVTAVRPLFDEESTVVARPVEPLDDRDVADDVGTYVHTGTAPAAVERAWKRRARMTVAFVIAALFLGTVAGILGLRFYQRSRAADAPVEPAQGAVEITQPPAEPVNVAVEPQPSPQETTAAPAVDDAKEEAKTEPRAESEKATAVEKAAPRKIEDNAEQERAAVPVRRGKRDVAIEEDDEPLGERVYDTQSQTPASPEAERRARREEERLRRVEQSERRARRRERRARSVDSIRAIFEGREESPPR